MMSLMLIVFVNSLIPKFSKESVSACVFPWLNSLILKFLIKSLSPVMSVAKFSKS